MEIIVMRLFYLSILALFLVSSSFTTILYAADETEEFEESDQSGEEIPADEGEDLEDAPEEDA